MINNFNSLINYDNNIETNGKRKTRTTKKEFHTR